MLRLHKASCLGSNYVIFFLVIFFIAGNLVSPGQHSRGNVFAKLGVGVGVFSRYVEPLYLKNCWTYQNEYGSIRSSSAPFFFCFWFVPMYRVLYQPPRSLTDFSEVRTLNSS